MIKTICDNGYVFMCAVILGQNKCPECQSDKLFIAERRES